MERTLEWVASYVPATLVEMDEWLLAR